MNIVLIPNRDKPDAVAAAGELQRLLRARAGEITATLLLDSPADRLAQLKPNLVVVLGGDGSILSIAQVMRGLDVPVVGINFGKIGYLAAFSFEQFKQHLDTILSGQAPTTNRLMLCGEIYHRETPDGQIQPLQQLLAQKPLFAALALNDVVINAGDPFRMIGLAVQIDEEATTTFRSDGVVVATASGSTGYNLSAGGPLLSPQVNAMVLTPICPHSLSFRPVVIPDSSAVLIVPQHLNAGSKVNFDGQVTYPITEDQCLLVRRAARPLRLVENPSMSHWRMLATKLQWAQSPRH